MRNMLMQHEIFLEKVGGDILDVEVSAKKGLNLDKLEETILLQAEILDLKATPNPQFVARAARPCILYHISIFI